MNVVALVSGGKDSCFAALKARRHGHRIVALAHIKAPCDEADSMMYQSVGSSAIAKLASAFGCPLVTRETQAYAKCTRLNYTPVDGDEVEDLVALLRDVKRDFPNVQAVCSGALWSDYQRLRVENAAYRTGLISLAPLWRRNQAHLLDEMIDSGLDAVLIKVAGVGLNRNHLGMTLAEMRPILLNLEKIYGSHVCGEGGEFETFVRWMPGFQKRLHFDHTEIVSHSYDPIAPVFFLRLCEISILPISSAQTELNAVEENWRLTNAVKDPELFKFSPTFYQPTTDNLSARCTASQLVDRDFLSSGEKFAYISVTSDRSGADGVKDVCESVRDRVFMLGENIGNIVFVQLFLRDATGVEYKEVNRVYNSFFDNAGADIVPGRACVGMGSGIRGTSMEALVRRGNRHDVQVLHVQSVSEWAPPCIGPYCQFVEEDGIFHVSGVLPLHAPTAEVPHGMPAAKQVELCLHNMRETLSAGRGKMELIRIFVVFCCSQEAASEIPLAMKTFLPTECIAVQLPVQSLPKGAVVEIRGVGTLEKSSEHLLLSPDVEKFTSHSVVCNDLAFAVFEGSFPLNAEVFRSIYTVQGWVPLSIQIYYKRDEHSAVHFEKETENITNQTQLSNSGGVAWSTFECSWFHSPRILWIILVTYSRRSKPE